MKVRSEKTTEIIQIHTEWSVWGADNKAADMLCAYSMNKGKTLIRMTLQC